MHRTWIRRPFAVIPVMLLGVACASESPDNAGTGGRGSGGATGGAGPATSGGAPDTGTATGGTPAANGGGGSPVTGGGMSGLGVGGTAPATGGAGGSGGTMGNATGGMGDGGAASGGAAAGGAAAGGAGGMNNAPTDYKCTRVVGASQANEWFEHEEGGMSLFESLVGNDKWELKAQGGAQTWKWEDPNQAIWGDDAGGIPIISSCAGNIPPDRITAYHVCYQYENREAWDKGLAAFIANIKAKYPTVKRIDLFTGNRCNADMANCAVGPEVTPHKNTCFVIPFIDEAFAAAAAANPGLVFVGPKFEFPCADFVDGAGGHLKLGPPQAAAARKYADYYKGL